MEMIEVNIVSNTGKCTLSSHTVKEHLEDMAEIITVSDISGVCEEKNIMLFDCKLDNLVFKFSYFDGSSYEETDVGEEYYQILLDEIDSYIETLTEEIQSELSILYHVDDIRIKHKIYDLNETFSDVKFIIAISFHKKYTQRLAEVVSATAKRQVLGRSRYFN